MLSRPSFREFIGLHENQMIASPMAVPPVQQNPQTQQLAQTASAKLAQLKAAAAGGKANPEKTKRDVEELRRISGQLTDLQKQKAIGDVERQVADIQSQLGKQGVQTAPVPQAAPPMTV